MTEYREIPINKIVPGINPVRSSPLNVDDLKESITRDGILQPIIVQSMGDTYEIISGYRRYEAAKSVFPATQTIPCMVLEIPLTFDDVSFLSAIENVQRTDLSPIEKGDWVLRMWKTGYSYKDIANRIGKTESTVKRWKEAAEIVTGVAEVLKDMSPEEEKVFTSIIRSAGREESVEDILEPYEVPIVTQRLIGSHIKDKKKQAEIFTAVRAFDLSMYQTEQMLELLKETPEITIEETAKHVKDSISLSILIPYYLVKKLRDFSKDLDKSINETVEWIIEKVITEEKLLNLLRKELLEAKQHE